MIRFVAENKKFSAVFSILPKPFLRLIFYGGAERRKRQSRNFKELLAKGNSDYGNAPQNAVYCGGGGNFPPENKHPKHIQQNAAHACAGIVNLLAEGRGAKLCHFKALFARGNSDYCYAKQKPRYAPFQPKQKSAEYKPQDIAQNFHLKRSFPSRFDNFLFIFAG